MMAEKVRVIFYGLGEMGRRIAECALKKDGLEAVGAVDIAKEVVGRDLGEIVGIGSIGVKVTDDVDDLFARVRADIVVQATVSDLPRALPQIEKCAKAGMNVVSTCEELSYPYFKYPELSSQIDNLARNRCVTVLGTGINPGYLMDTLSITLSGACQDVRSIRVTRLMDSSKRRIPFQKKVGEGLTPEEFKEKIEKKLITGHVGLIESIAAIAGALGLHLDEVRELPPEPVIAAEELNTSHTIIRKGQVAGLKSVAYGSQRGEKLVMLEFVAHAGVEEEYDSIEIDGTPSIRQKIAGGIHGDLGTAAVVVNMIPKVLNAEPGLVTMHDLPPVSATPADMRTYIKWRKMKG